MTTGPVRHQRVLDGCVQPECLDRIHQVLAELWIADGDIAEVDRMLFETAVIEVAGNIVRHGRGPGGFDGRVTVNVYDAALEAVFQDTADEVGAAVIDAAGIDPAGIDPAVIDPAVIDPAVIDPAGIDPGVDSTSEVWPDEMAEHGRGLAIARSVVDELSYQRIDGVNQWRVCRVRTG